MQNASQPAHRLNELLEPSFWNRNRGWIIGSIVLAAIILSVALYFQDFGDRRDREAWQKMTVEGTPGQLRTEIPIDEVEGTSAEPWALLTNARTAYHADRLEEAQRWLDRLRSEFPNHLATQSEAVTQLASDLEAEARFRSANPRTEIANPEVPAPRSVLLRTDLGDIRIGLHLEEAPVATREFLRLVRSGELAQATFDEAVADRSVLLSVPGSASAESKNGEEEGENEATLEEDAGEPSALVRGVLPDRNRLSHVRGAVAFHRAPPGSIPPGAGPRIAIYLADSPMRQGEEVVFGSVIEGLDLLETISDRAKEEGAPNRLQEPVALTGVEEGEELTSVSLE